MKVNSYGVVGSSSLLPKWSLSHTILWQLNREWTGGEETAVRGAVKRFTMVRTKNRGTFMQETVVMETNLLRSHVLP